MHRLNIKKVNIGLWNCFCLKKKASDGEPSSLETDTSPWVVGSNWILTKCVPMYFTGVSYVPTKQDC